VSDVRPAAAISLDLDNKWSYLKTHGDPSWVEFPSYLDLVVPRILALLKDRHLHITFFIVGQDAARDSHYRVLQSIATAGHEIGNHSFSHEPWLHLYSDEAIDDEIADADREIKLATGQRPVGFRGPGYSLSPAVIRALTRRGYLYDATILPTFIGPFSRAYYFGHSRLTRPERRRRQRLFGSLRDGLRPNRPYQWQTRAGILVEIPVTTMPLLRLPIHVSYLLFLSTISLKFATMYFEMAVRLCRLTGSPMSLLLHPLDFLALEEAPELAFFPAMRLPLQTKLNMVSTVVHRLQEHFRLLTLQQLAQDAAPAPASLQGLPRADWALPELFRIPR
jgi:peptidoglycan/xylan/chitin deacetylase (PgdA/CDA1 family)